MNAPSDRGQGEWLPIESAPTGEKVLVCVSGFPQSAWIAIDIGKRKRIWMLKGSGRRLHMVPTHWMHIPTPPDSGEK